jgi:hypothetical protein
METYARRWCGESYGAVVPKYMDPSAIIKTTSSNCSKSNVDNRNIDESVIGESVVGERNGVTNIGDQNKTNETNQKTLIKRKKSVYAYQSENTKETGEVQQNSSELKSSNTSHVSYPNFLDKVTTKAVVTLQAHARGFQAREKVVDLLIVDRRLRTLKKRASVELGGLENIHELSIKYQNSQKELNKSISVRNESVKRMREAEKERATALEMMEEMQLSLDNATLKLKKTEERLKAAEETIIGCDEMLVDKDKKISTLETEVKMLKTTAFASRRSPPLMRGTGGGGGGGTPNQHQQEKSAIEKELDQKNILVERLSAKLEHSEYIIQQMIRANAGGNNGGGQRVPQVREGRGGGKGRRRRYEVFDDY